MKRPTKDLTKAQLRRLPVRKAIALIQKHYGFGTLMAEQFYGFLLSGGDVAGQKPVKQRRRPKAAVNA
jgi:hypothetical protein